MESAKHNGFIKCYTEKLFALLLLLSLGGSLGSLLGDLLLLLLIDVVDVVRSSVTDEVADLFFFSLGTGEGAELKEGNDNKTQRKSLRCISR